MRRQRRKEGIQKYFVKFEQIICLNRLTIDIFLRKTLKFVCRRFRNASRLWIVSSEISKIDSQLLLALQDADRSLLILNLAEENKMGILKVLKWQFLPAIACFNIAYLISYIFPFWCLVLIFTGFSQLIYGYYNSISVRIYTIFNLLFRWIYFLITTFML